MKKCSKCGANAESEFCFRHKPRKPLPSYKQFGNLRMKGDPKSIMYDPLTGDIIPPSDNEMYSFFSSIWEKRKHVSEISGEYLGKELLSIYFHHCAPKEKYEEGRYDEENIILLTAEEHDTVENDMYAFEKVTEIRERMIEKYTQ